jgi:4-hydroxybenzoate polyprenyltransferase
MNRIIILLKLARWREHLLFTIPVTLLGSNMALQQHHSQPDGWMLIAFIANSLAVSFAFMVNDIEDANDDARETHRAIRNAVTQGEISRRAAWIAAILVGGLALGLYTLINAETAVTGVITLGLAFLYSWRGVRLKALPLVDVISHLLMLSALLFLAGYFTYASTLDEMWLIALGVGLVSGYGQLYNQLRDYDMDRAAGLHNTASVLGKRWTQNFMYFCLGLAAMCLGISVGLGLWPWWLALIPLGMLPIWFLFRSSTDMRGTQALDITGQAQTYFFVVATITMVMWSLVLLYDYFS